uniref:Putative secreted protein n=1 Tax=Anopheles darlingi TaxID=43151 RepID=A0A2M4DDI2_ANODA
MYVFPLVPFFFLIESRGGALARPCEWQRCGAGLLPLCRVAILCPCILLLTGPISLSTVQAIQCLCFLCVYFRELPNAGVYHRLQD